jgi:hypothetical protein
MTPEWLSGANMGRAEPQYVCVFIHRHVVGVYVEEGDRAAAGRAGLTETLFEHVLVPRIKRSIAQNTDLRPLRCSLTAAGQWCREKDDNEHLADEE